MAFDRANLSIVVNNVKSGVVPSSWIYWDEDGDTVTAAGFFTDYRLNVGDQIVSLAAAYTSSVTYRVSAVTSGAATVVASSNTSTVMGGLQALSGAGAVDIVTGTTLVTSGGADALTLADGASGQRKVIKMVSDGGDATLTPAHFGDGATLTFDNTDAAELIFDGTEWWTISATAALA